MTHTCHAIGCNTLVPPKMFMCKPHWFELPPVDRDLIWALYNPGQEIRESSRIIREQAVRAGVIKGDIICDGCKEFKPFRIHLDGDDLCQDCADKWVQGEGIAAMEAEKDATP